MVFGTALFKNIQRGSCVVALLASTPCSAHGSEEPRAESERVESFASGYWEGAEARPFVSASVMGGYYSEVQLAVGYGRPHWLWGGLLATGMLTPDFAAVAVGARIDLLLANLDVRVRRTTTRYASFAPRASTYEAGSFRDPEQRRAHYTSVDATLSGVVPTGPLFAYWAVRTVTVPSLGDDESINTQLHRHPMDSKSSWMPQLIWWGAFLEESLLVGPSVDAVFSGSRSPLIRAGASVLYSFGPHLSVEAMLTVPVSTPDSLPVFDQVWGNLDVAWAWASGE